MSNAFNRRHFLRMGLGAGIGAGIAMSLSGCVAGKPVPVPSDDNAKDIVVTVYVGDNFYEPTQVDIKQGQAVRWEWVGKEQHDVVSNDRTFVTELQVEGSYVHEFTEAGDFSYFCSIHPEMRGVISVE